jgi:hypothetical protein
MTDAAFWWVNTVTVETYLGSGAFGPSYGSPQQVACWLEDQVKLVRNAKGDQVVSSSCVYAALDDAALFAPDSKVTTPTGVGLVITCRREDSGSLDLGIDHIQVDLS